MWSDILTTREVDFTQRAMDVLATVTWAEPLLRRVADAGGLVASAMPLLFEVRFAYEIHRAGHTAEYEHRAGVNESTGRDGKIPRPVKRVDTASTSPWFKNQFVKRSWRRG